MSTKDEPSSTSADVNGWEVTEGCFVKSNLLPVAGFTLRHTESIVPTKHHPALPGWFVRLGNGGEDFMPDENVVLICTKEMVEAANAPAEDEDEETQQELT